MKEFLQGYIQKQDPPPPLKEGSQGKGIFDRLVEKYAAEVICTGEYPDQAPPILSFPQNTVIYPILSQEIMECRRKRKPTGRKSERRKIGEKIPNQERHDNNMGIAQGFIRGKGGIRVIRPRRRRK